MSNSEEEKSCEQPACSERMPSNDIHTSCDEKADVRLPENSELLMFLHKSRLLAIEIDDDLRDRSSGRVADFDD